MGGNGGPLKWGVVRDLCLGTVPSNIKHISSFSS